MQGDVLTVRQSKGKEDDAVEGESSNSEGETDNESDEDEDSSGSESENEEAKAEAEKAAKFFDNDAIDSSESVDVFAQLNLSRPLLRGVASIGFVSPTPIQTRVIPIALSGRDICAR
jgi:ATP-dependent RNA helicase DDX27